MTNKIKIINYFVPALYLYTLVTASKINDDITCEILFHFTTMGHRVHAFMNGKYTYAYTLSGTIAFWLKIHLLRLPYTQTTNKLIESAEFLVPRSQSKKQSFLRLYSSPTTTSWRRLQMFELEWWVFRQQKTHAENGNCSIKAKQNWSQRSPFVKSKLLIGHLKKIIRPFVKIPRTTVFFPCKTFVYQSVIRINLGNFIMVRRWRVSPFDIYVGPINVVWLRVYNFFHTWCNL